MSDQNLNQQLPILHALQEIDSQIKKLEEQKKSIPVTLEQLTTAYQKHKGLMESKDDELRMIQKELRSQSGTLELQQEQLKKYNTQLKSVQTDRQYKALEREIKHIQKKNSEMEDEILELLFSIDAATEELKNLQTKLTEEEAQYKRREDDLLSTSKSLTQQIAGLTQKRSAYYDKIDAQLLQQYDEWRLHRNKFLLSIVSGNSCGGCNLTILPQTINEIRKKEKLLFCGSCHRILYLPEEQTEE